jgi:hypothetical protein
VLHSGGVAEKVRVDALFDPGRLGRQERNIHFYMRRPRMEGVFA